MSIKRTLEVPIIAVGSEISMRGKLDLSKYYWVEAYINVLKSAAVYKAETMIQNHEFWMWKINESVIS